MNHSRKIVVGVALHGAPGRMQCAGILRYIGRRSDWNLVIVNTPEELLQEVSGTENKRRADGFIVGALATTAVREALAKITIPTAVIGFAPELFAPRSRAFSCVRLDNPLIGKRAATHLLSLGNFRTYGYVPTERRTYWSGERQEGFGSNLQNTGKSFKVFPGGSHDALVAWVAKIPKPAAIFAVNDVRAAQVIDAARESNITIPQQLVVLGVDDDELICESTNPKLSSLRPNHEETGFKAARELERLLKGRAAPSRRPVCGVDRLVIRDSTRSPSPSASLIRRARNLIATESSNGLTPDRLADLLGVSRRLLDLRFHEFEKRTVSAAITDQKLKTFKSRLLHSGTAINELAASCGFKNANALRNLFRKRYGKSPSAFRN